MKKLIILCTLLSLPLFAQDFVLENGKAVPTFLGQIKLFKGKVYKKTDKDMKLIQHGERFHKNDILVTEEKSLAKIMMIDDSIISIGPKSEFVIDNYEFSDKVNRKFGYTLFKGQLTGNIKNKAKAGDIYFKTKYTTLGVRGTYIMMNARMQGDLEIAEYALLSGSAEIKNDKNKTFPIAKGERFNFVRDQARSVEEKIQLSPEDMKRYQAEELDEEKNFKPFLDYLNTMGLSPDSPFYNIFGRGMFGADSKNDEKSAALDEQKTEKRESNKPGWQENLKKLNERLKENQKKK